MLSKFKAQHDSVDVFRLDEDEWNEAINQYPELNNSNQFINYYQRSANAWIIPKKDNYFDNDTILDVLKRLLIMLRF